LPGFPPSKKDAEPATVRDTTRSTNLTAHARALRGVSILLLVLVLIT